MRSYQHENKNLRPCVWDPKAYGSFRAVPATMWPCIGLLRWEGRQSPAHSRLFIRRNKLQARSCTGTGEKLCCDISLLRLIFRGTTRGTLPMLMCIAVADYDVLERMPPT